MSETTKPSGGKMREFYGSIRGLITEIDTVSKRAWLQPIGADYFVEVCFPPDLDPATVFPQCVEVMGTVRKNEHDCYVSVLAEQVRPLQDPELSWTDLFGYMPEITGGLPLDEYMAQLRGEYE